MPGRTMSWMNPPPVTLAIKSFRGTGWPTILYWLGSLALAVPVMLSAKSTPLTKFQ